jgi:hypothetical protein
MGQIVRPLVAMVVVVAVIGGGFLLLRDRLSGAAEDLRVGDCFDVPGEETISSIQHQPCTETHDGEVFVVGNIEADSYPVVFGFGDWVETNCLGSAFESFVGEPAEARDDIDVGYFAPTRDGWDGGDREITCYLTPADGQKITHSYNGGSAPASS